MGHTEHRRKLVFIENAFVVIFAALFIFSTVLTLNSFATSSVFKVQGVSLDELSTTASGSISNYDDAMIISDVTFHNIDDYAKYTIKFKNTDSKDHTIESISDNNANPYIIYEYTSPSNIVVKAGEEYDFNFTAKYATTIASVSERAQSVDISFSIKHVGAEEPETVVITPDPSTLLGGGTTNPDPSTPSGGATNPDPSTPSGGATNPDPSTPSGGNTTNPDPAVDPGNNTPDDSEPAVPIPNTSADPEKKAPLTPDTGDFTVASKTGDTVRNNIILLVVSTTGLIICVAVVLRRHKKLQKIVAIMIAAASFGTVTATVRAAATETSAFTVTTTYDLHNLLTVDYYIAGTHYDDSVVEYGKAIENILSIPAVDGYTASAWKTADGQDFDTASIITDDIALYTTYSANTYSVAFDGNGATSGTMQAQGFTYDQTDELSTNLFAREKYNFVGWNTVADGSGDSYADGESVSNLSKDDGDTVTLYAQWEKKVVTVNLHGNGLQFADNSETTVLKFAENCHDKFFPAVQYSHTDNIDDDGNVDGNYGPDQAVADVITVPNAASLHVKLTYGIESGYDLLYVFEGKYTGEINDHLDAGQLETYTSYEDEPTTIEFDVDGDTVTFAFFSDYSVTAYGYYAIIEGLDANGDAVGGETRNVCELELASGSYDEPLYNDQNQYAYGWSFTVDGYPDLAGYDQVRIVAINSELGDTVDLYAFWFYYHTIAYDKNGGEGTTGSHQVPGGFSDYLHANQFYRDGYEFIGWSLDPNATIPEYEEGDEFYVPNNAETTTLYAIWAKQHQISFNANGGEGTMVDQFGIANSSVRLNSNTFTREHYKFIGWSENQNATSAAYTDRAYFSTPAEAGLTTLYAVWKADYRIVFDANGGEGEMTEQYIDYGTSSATLTSNSFTRERYQFLGWSTDENAASADYSNGGRFYTSGAAEVTRLYAVWRTQHRIMYNANGGVGEMADQYLNSYSSTNLSANTFTREGFVFVGWSKYSLSTTANYADKASFSAGYPTPNETTLYAIWAKPYSIVFDANGGEGDMTGYKTEIAKVGDKGTLVASNYSRADYGFLGWSLDPDAGSKANNYNPPTIYGPNETITLTSALKARANEDNEITFYAVWLEKDPNYTLQTFDKSVFANRKVVALEDTRDGEVYAVGKQADGSWWMMENLRLNPSRNDVTINSSNTNNPTSTFISQIAGYKGKAANQTYFSPTFNLNATHDSCDRATCTDHVSFGLGNIMREYESSPTAGTQEASWYSYGVVYNFYTATAGNGVYNSTIQNVTAGDICPSNWRIPEGSYHYFTDIANELQILANTMAGITPINKVSYSLDGDNAVLFNKYPMNIVYSGIYGSNAGFPDFASYRGKAGIYITNYRVSNRSAAELYIQNSYSYYGNTAQLGNVTNKAVRCIAK